MNREKTREGEGRDQGLRKRSKDPAGGVQRTGRQGLVAGWRLGCPGWCPTPQGGGGMGGQRAWVPAASPSAPTTSFGRKCSSLIRIIYKIMVHCLH